MTPLSKNLNLDWYDQEVKEKYLETITDSQRPYMIFFLNRMSEHEKRIGSPLYDQQTVEIERFLFSLSPLTVGTSAKGLGYVRRYLEFSIRLGVKQTNIIQIDTSREHASKFIPKNPRGLLTWDELQATIANCENYQDKAIFALLFAGVKGASISEIRELEPKWVYSKILDGERQYFIDINTSEDKNRTIPIHESFYNILHAAAEQEFYILNNGHEVSENILSKRGNMVPLTPTRYIMKRSKIGKGAQDLDVPMGYHGLYQRVNRIRDYEEFQDIDPDYLNFNNIYLSGALYEMYRVVDRKYADGLLDAYTEEERANLYKKIDLKAVVAEVQRKYIYVNKQKANETLTIENLLKYY